MTQDVTPSRRRAPLPIAAPVPGDVRVSFEFFPPRSDDMERSLWTCIERLAPLKPAFVSVTYGAGGSTRERTHATVLRIQKETALKAAAHLTCVDATRAEVDDVARTYWQGGIRHVVALRGDPPAKGTAYRPNPDGYRHAADLVAGLKRIAPFEISVAAYPETHPEATSARGDLINLKRKVDAGADRAITQFFFQNDAFLRFRDRVRRAGIAVPLVPGILPVTSAARVRQFAQTCGASVPDWMVDLFAGLDEDPETRKLVAATLAAEQCRALYAEGVRDFHFYTLNRADLVYAICHILGVRAEPLAAQSPQPKANAEAQP
jgi:methylenetetrahydrofolate reductase (NADPH)